MAGDSQGLAHPRALGETGLPSVAPRKVSWKAAMDDVRQAASGHTGQSFASSGSPDVRGIISRKTGLSSSLVCVQGRSTCYELATSGHSILENKRPLCPTLPAPSLPGRAMQGVGVSPRDLPPVSELETSPSTLCVCPQHTALRVPQKQENESFELLCSPYRGEPAGSISNSTAASPPRGL